MKGDIFLKTKTFALLIVIAAFLQMLAVLRVQGFASFEVLPTENHHIVELNSDQPYVAGYSVKTENMSTYEMVDGVCVTVSFPATDPRFFPPDWWIGGGMFVQAQDHKFRNVDYGFYMMLVLDSAGSFFVDLGLHQTREGTLPIQMPTEELICAHTWKFVGVSWTAPVTLVARWDQNGYVHYSVSALGQTLNLTSVKIDELLNCENIMYNFYSGNVIIEPFPFSVYVNYFQFGVVSPESVAVDDWVVDLKEPKVLDEQGWTAVEKAWSIQGDISYLDKDWKWGGQPYRGVDAQYYHNALSNQGEVIFFYNGHSLISGRILWDSSALGTNSPTLVQLRQPYYFGGAILTFISVCSTLAFMIWRLMLG